MIFLYKLKTINSILIKIYLIKLWSKLKKKIYIKSTIFNYKINQFKKSF